MGSSKTAVPSNRKGKASAKAIDSSRTERRDKSFNGSQSSSTTQVEQPTNDKSLRYLVTVIVSAGALIAAAHFLPTLHYLIGVCITMTCAVTWAFWVGLFGTRARRAATWELLGLALSALLTILILTKLFDFVMDTGING